MLLLELEEELRLNFAFGKSREMQFPPTRNENWRVTGFVHLRAAFRLESEPRVRALWRLFLNSQTKGWEFQNWISWLESISRGENDIPMVKWCPWVPSMQGVSRRTVCANFCLVNPPAKKGKQHSKLLDISFLPRCSSSSRSFSVKHRTSRTRCSGPPDAQLGKVVKLKQLAFEACRRYALLCSTPTAVARGNLFFCKVLLLRRA